MVDTSRRSAEAEHYFTAAPSSPEQRRTIDVVLAGEELRLATASGVFSADHLDRATQVLLDHVPAPPPRGTLLDLGCGWGPVALTAALRSPGLEVVAVDVNDRALDLTRRNAETAGVAGRVRALRPEDVPTGLRFEALWSNPPVRIGKDALHGLLGLWLGRLTDDGVAHLVVAKNLGADSLARWLGESLRCEVERVASVKTFRVLRVGRPRG